MKNRTGRKTSVREKLAAALLLLAYLVCLLVLDPAWVMWAGQMAMGVLYFTDLPPETFSFSIPPLAVFASYLSGLSALVAFGILTGVVGDGRPGGQ